MKKIFILTIAAFSFYFLCCSPSEYIEVNFERVRIVKIDTIYRFGSDKLYIVMQSDRGIEYTSYADLKDKYILGTVYLMVVRK